MKKLLLIVIGLFSVSCVSVYHTGKLRHNFNDAESKITNNRKEMQKDYSLKKQTYNLLLSKTSNQALKPYPRMNTVLKNMLKNIEGYSNEEEQLQSVRAGFEKMVKGKKKVKSQQPEFNKIKMVIGDYKKAMKNLEKRNQIHKKLSKQFQNLVKKVK